MMFNRNCRLLGLAAAFGAGILSAQPVTGAGVSPEVRDSLNRINLGQQEIERKAGADVAEGNRLYTEGKYFEARDRYLSAVKLFRTFASDAFRSQLEYCRNQILNCYIAQAGKMLEQADRQANAHDFEEAIRLCREALEYCPEYADKLNARIAFYEKRRVAAASRSELSEERLIPNQKTQDYQIQLLLEQGRKFVSAKEYSRAVEKFQEVLLLDPYNATALQNIKACYTRIGRIGIERMADTHRKMIAEIEWDFAMPYVAEANTVATENLLGATPKVKEQAKANPFEQKLDSIIIPYIYFEDVTLPAAVKNLRDQSRQHDPEQLGVNIILRRAPQPETTNPDGTPVVPGPDGTMPGPGAGQNQANTEDAGEEGEEEVDPATLGPRVTLLLKNKSLKTAIDELCRAAKLRFKIDKYAVVIAPQNVALEDMETRIFPVDRDVLKQAIDGDNLSSSALSKYFATVADANFPNGSRIIYDDKISRLIVTNTVENLKRIDQQIQNMANNQTPMVQLMLKFVEVSQNDLKELAFNYSLAINSQNADGRWQMGESGSNLLRYYDPQSQTATTGQSIAQSSTSEVSPTLSFGFMNSDGSTFWASLFALDWAKSEDVLAAPRVTTLAGQVAHVQMTEDRYFPDEWETIDLPTVSTTTGDNPSGYIWQGTRADPQPTYDSDPTPLGIAFDIRPIVSNSNSRVIEAEVKLPILTFDGWEVYDPRTSTPTGSDTENTDSEDEFFKKPRFNRRMIRTYVSVYDGETIVLGGVSSDNVERINDKIPILGDLPIVGRLFQSKYDKAEKRSLLIFLTCRLVKPDGTAMYPAEKRSRGVPNSASSY